MLSLNNLKVRKKLWLIIGSALAGIVVIIAMSLVMLKNDLKDEKALKTRHLVETAYSTIDYYYRLAADGKMTQEEAKAAAIAAVKNMRYEEKEYFWINDMHPTMIMHPYKPELDGKDLSDFKDNEGKKLFVEFVKTVKAEKAGFVYYLWPKPGFEKPVLKVSYVKGFEPWGWIVGSGIYLDDLDTLFWSKSRQYGLVAFVVFLMILAMSWLVAKNITRNLTDLTDKIGLISDGDLRIAIEAKGSDEFGILARDINKMAVSLNEMINQIFDSINNVVQIVDTVKIKSEQTAEAAQKQSLQATGIATAAEEMSHTINDMARNAATAADTSADAMKTAASGKDVADGAVATIDRVFRATVDLAQMIERLSSSVSEIGDIVTVINDIADQTNLLALNASIEAARAGEHGRGFAVVADEVRKLAERTIRATAEISKKIGAVQQESEQTTKSMAEASGEVTMATDYIKEVGSTLNHIVEAVQNSRDQITQIATAIEQQSATTEELAQNFEHTSAAAVQMERMSEEVTQAVYKLSHIDEEIRNSTSGFKTVVSGLQMLDMAKTDHRIFVNKLGACMSGGKKMDVAQMPDHHTCRFGKWYDTEGKHTCANSKSYKTIAVPHEKIHTLAKEAAVACNTGDKAKSKRLYTEIEGLSNEISRLLDDIKSECSKP